MITFDHCHEDQFSITMQLVLSQYFWWQWWSITGLPWCFHIQNIHEPTLTITITMITGPPWCFHIHEPSVHGDLDVRRLCLHRRQHRPLPCKQVSHKRPNLYKKICLVWDFAGIRKSSCNNHLEIPWLFTSYDMGSFPNIRKEFQTPPNNLTFLLFCVGSIEAGLTPIKFYSKLVTSLLTWAPL